MNASDSPFELTVADIGFGGDGVGRDSEGRAVFVPFAAVGDTLQVRLTEAHAKYARAEIVDILTPGPGRTVPRCPHFGRCGGCVYQHLSYETELAAKKGQLASLLARVGALEDLPELEAVVPSTKLFEYRNKLRLRAIIEDPAAEDRLVTYGYCERDNTTFFELDACPLVHASLNHLLPRAPKTDLGKRNGRSPKPAPMTLRVTHDGTTMFYFGRAPKRIPWLHEQLLGRDVSVPLGSFWQVNEQMADTLVAHVAGWFRESPTRTLVDAYSGVGTFSLGIGDAAQSRFLIESDEQALKAAEYNHAQWGIKNCHFRRGTTENELSRLLASCNLRRTTVLLDPPRQGCGDKAIRALKEFSPHQIIMVSCNAATLARDVKALMKDGAYRMVRLALFDMFPRTAHFETAALLVRSS